MPYKYNEGAEKILKKDRWPIWSDTEPVSVQSEHERMLKQQIKKKYKFKKKRKFPKAWTDFLAKNTV